MSKRPNRKEARRLNNRGNHWQPHINLVSQKIPSITKTVIQIDNDNDNSCWVETKFLTRTVEVIRVNKSLNDCVNDLLNNDYRIIKKYDGYQIIKG